MSFVILIPAAGASRRMRGRDKLLEPVGGLPILAHLAQLALHVCAEVLVTLPPQAKSRQAALQGLSVKMVTITDAAQGMSASLRAGALHAAARGAHLLVLPADMPKITSADLRTMMTQSDHYPRAILQATAADGTPGHPVVFPPALLPDFQALRGDEGAKSILRTHKTDVISLALPQDHATLDLDTPEDWEAWRHTAPY